MELYKNPKYINLGTRTSAGAGILTFDSFTASPNTLVIPNMVTMTQDGAGNSIFWLEVTIGNNIFATAPTSMNSSVLITPAVLYVNGQPFVLKGGETITPKVYQPAAPINHTAYMRYYEVLI